GEAIVRRTADMLAGEALSERRWRKLLHDGFDENLGVEFASAEYVGSGEPVAEAPQLSLDVDQDDIDVLFVPADGLYDGRFANNGWLQEMPQRITKLTWDNAAIMSPRTARELGVRHGVMVALGEDLLELPVYEIPGVAPGVVVVPYVSGRCRAAGVGGRADLEIPGVGFAVQSLRTTANMQLATGIKARPRSKEYLLATTQDHWAIDQLGRDETEDRSYQLVREGSKALYD